MAIVTFKAPVVGPGCVYYRASEPGETMSIPDWHIAELDPKCLIVIQASSVVPKEEAIAPGLLLKHHDTTRVAAEEAEILQLRTGEKVIQGLPPEPAQPVIRRRSNVIPGSKI